MIYYNEHDPKAAAWLRELIKARLIAPGEVDERSIEDVRPAELRDFVQCHFFAGVGVWSYALRCAGWPDDRPVWTGSCPCQPFSAAGKGVGFADERHLWPAFHHLISQCSPPVVFGEQVASKDGLGWLDLVQADLEGSGYTFGAADLCAAGVGAPHIRQRLYWVADASGKLCSRQVGEPREQPQFSGKGSQAGGCLHSGGLAHNSGTRLEGCYEGTLGRECASTERGGGAGGLADAACGGCGELGNEAQQRGSRHPDGGGQHHGPGPTNGFWRDADWLHCRDGKWRAVRPSTFPLAHGAPSRVGRLRGYGNAICAPLAEEFIKACNFGS